MNRAIAGIDISKLSFYDRAAINRSIPYLKTGLFEINKKDNASYHWIRLVGTPYFLAISYDSTLRGFSYGGTFDQVKFKDLNITPKLREELLHHLRRLALISLYRHDI